MILYLLMKQSILNTTGRPKTNTEGVFVAGDADHVYRLAITAAATGCITAQDAERFPASKI